MRDRTVSGQAIREQCYARGMSLRQLARDAGLSYSYVKEVAAGRVQPRDHNAQKFATVLGGTVEDFSTPKTEPSGSAA